MRFSFACCYDIFRRRKTYEVSGRSIADAAEEVVVGGEEDMSMVEEVEVSCLNVNQGTNDARQAPREDVRESVKPVDIPGIAEDSHIPAEVTEVLEEDTRRSSVVYNRPHHHIVSQLNRHVRE